MEDIECLGLTFIRNFDSANLGKVEALSSDISVAECESHSSTSTKISDNINIHHEFNIWTTPDCCGTEFENGNRTWFYFGIRANSPSLVIKLNIVNLNKQAKMYSQGMCPVYKVVPSRNGWDRIRDKPTYTNEEEIFTLSFKYRTPENAHAITYFAFTYPFSYLDIQKMLSNIDSKVAGLSPIDNDDIYYVRELVCRSLDNRRVDLITITSKKGMTNVREPRLKNLFPEQNIPRPYKFSNKKVIFVSARVHPGETPSSFVFNGLLHLLLNRDDQVAVHLRRLYVFKFIPCLNPDGVSRGHYRTDSRGVNLNRMYLNPSLTLHPSIYAARALIRYYHYGCEKPDTITLCQSCIEGSSTCTEPVVDNSQSGNTISSKVSNMSLEENNDGTVCFNLKRLCTLCGSPLKNSSSEDIMDKDDEEKDDKIPKESGLFLYMDMHGHASKKGIFIYGNHFDTPEQNIECMLLPKLMSLNNHNFHFTGCNFSERNMFVKDKRDGMSRAGSGRVAISALTGLIKSYTLECNYNTGRIVNVLPPTIKERQQKAYTLPTPPKYSPQVFEEVGRSLGASILDLTGNNPMSRLPQSEFHSLNGVTEWIRNNCVHNFNESSHNTNLRSKTRSSLTQGAKRRTRVRSTPSNSSNTNSIKIRPSSVPIERKENVINFETETLKIQPTCSTKIPKRKAAIRIHKTTLKKSKSKMALSLKCKNVNEKCKLKGRKMEITTKFRTTETIASSTSENKKIDEPGKFQVYQIFETDEKHSNFLNVATEPLPCCSSNRVNNFSKNTFFSKNKKHLLRRIGSNGDGLNKNDKLKKKKRLVKKL